MYIVIIIFNDVGRDNTSPAQRVCKDQRAYKKF